METEKSGKWTYTDGEYIVTTLKVLPDEKGRFGGVYVMARAYSARGYPQGVPVRVTVEDDKGNSYTYTPVAPNMGLCAKLPDRLPYDAYTPAGNIPYEKPPLCAWTVTAAGSFSQTEEGWYDAGGTPVTLQFCPFCLNYAPSSIYPWSFSFRYPTFKNVLQDWTQEKNYALKLIPFDKSATQNYLLTASRSLLFPPPHTNGWEEVWPGVKWLANPGATRMFKVIDAAGFSQKIALFSAVTIEYPFWEENMDVTVRPLLPRQAFAFPVTEEGDAERAAFLSIDGESAEDKAKYEFEQSRGPAISWKWLDPATGEPFVRWHFFSFTVPEDKDYVLNLATHEGEGVILFADAGLRENPYTGNSMPFALPVSMTTPKLRAVTCYDYVLMWWDRDGTQYALPMYLTGGVTEGKQDGTPLYADTQTLRLSSPPLTGGEQRAATTIAQSPKVAISRSAAPYVFTYARLKDYTVSWEADEEDEATLEIEVIANYGKS